MLGLTTVGELDLQDFIDYTPPAPLMSFNQDGENVVVELTIPPRPDLGAGVVWPPYLQAHFCLAFVPDGTPNPLPSDAQGMVSQIASMGSNGIHVNVDIEGQAFGEKITRSFPIPVARAGGKVFIGGFIEDEAA